MSSELNLSRAVHVRSDRVSCWVLVLGRHMEPLPVTTLPYSTAHEELLGLLANSTTSRLLIPLAGLHCRVKKPRLFASSQTRPRYWIVYCES